MPVFYARYHSELGPGYLVLVDDKVRLLTLPGTEVADLKRLVRLKLGLSWAQLRPAASSEAAREVEAFLAGQRKEFSLAMDPPGTEFQRMVWRCLREIPYGTTVTYAEVARRIGRPRAARAVGAACAANPIALAIPCHRVVGADGALAGFAGGLALKASLLRLEREAR